MKKIILLDGNSLSYRAFFATPALKNKNGLYTNSVYGFTLMLEKILADEKPDFALVAFDKGKKTFRHQSYADYKGGRDKTPFELIEQFSYVRELLAAYGIKYEEHELYEADDIIGTYAKIAESKGYKVIIVSGDKDLTQLASDKITIHYTKRGVSELDYYTPQFIKEKYGLSPLQIIDMKGLMGDKSDNIPGVAGIGEKTAIKLLLEYGSVEEILDNVANISGAKLKEKLLNGRNDAMVSKELATIYTKVPVNHQIEDLTFDENINQKIAIFEKLEFSSFLKKLDIQKTAKAADKIEIVKADTNTTLDLQNSAIYLETFTEDYQNSDCLYVAVYSNQQSYIFSEDDFFNNQQVITYLSSNEDKNIYDLKKFIYRAYAYGVTVKGYVFDARIVNYLLDVSIKDSIDKIVYHYLGESLPSDEEIYGKGVKRAIPNETILHHYLSTIVKWNAALKQEMEMLLEEKNMTNLYKGIELPLVWVLADMEHRGICVNQLELAEISKDLDKRTSDIEAAIFDYAGKSFNISSPKQLGQVLFEDMGLPHGKKTKTGYSTSVEVLEFLEKKHPIIPLIMEYRTITKLNSTYAKGLVKDIKNDGRIHTRFEQTLAQTGRLSSINPNLQNIPVRLADGKKIRRAFVAKSEDYRILSIDYSQIELRVLAHIANDPVMLEAFNHNEDIHTKTASQVNGIHIESVTDDMRREAKAVNFGIVYGISDFGLANNLGISIARAKEFIDKYLKTFSGVKQYMDDIVAYAKEKEYVETLFLRRRPLAEINSRNKMIVALNSRIAMNTPIQGTAADIIKIAMIKVFEFLKSSNLRAEMLLQVHDELIFDVHKDDLKVVEENIKAIMESAVEMKVKLKADSSYGKNWYEAK